MIERGQFSGPVLVSMSPHVSKTLNVATELL